MDGDFIASKLSQAQGRKCCKPRSETTTLHFTLRLLRGSHTAPTLKPSDHACSLIDESALFAKLTSLLKNHTIPINITLLTVFV